VLTGGMANLKPCLLVHSEIVNIKNGGSRGHLAGITPAKPRRALAIEVGRSISADDSERRAIASTGAPSLPSTNKVVPLT
jgi:hypothetical protein